MNKDRLLQTFLDLVKIPSESGHEKLVTEYLSSRLTDLGMEFWIDDAGSKIASNTGNIIGRMKGTLPGAISFSSHQDTVVPGIGVKPVVADGVIKSDGTTVLGADDKAGLAIILEMLEYFKNNPHPTIEVIFDICEEVGLRGAAVVDLSKLESKISVILDINGTPGRINIAAPFQDIIKVTITGKAAHAGVSPENGISAIEVASKAIAKMKLGRLDEESTANVGVISGGKATNIVAVECKIDFEARSRDEIKLNTQTSHMIECLLSEAKQAKAEIEIKKERVFVGYKFMPTDKLPLLISKAATDLSIIPTFVKSGGGSVANIFNEKGIQSVVIAVGFENMHTNEEFIRISDLELSTRWVIRMVELVK